MRSETHHHGCTKDPKDIQVLLGSACGRNTEVNPYYHIRHMLKTCWMLASLHMDPNQNSTFVEPSHEHNEVLFHAPISAPSHCHPAPLTKLSKMDTSNPTIYLCVEMQVNQRTYRLDRVMFLGTHCQLTLCQKQQQVEMLMVSCVDWCVHLRHLAHQFRDRVKESPQREC